MRSGKAYLLLTGKKQGSAAPDSLVFCLNACIDELTPSVSSFLCFLSLFLILIKENKKTYWNIFCKELCKKLGKKIILWTSDDCSFAPETGEPVYYIVDCRISNSNLDNI